MQRTSVIPVPTVVIPAHIRQGITPIVPVTTTVVVPKQTIAVPTPTTTVVPIPTPRIQPTVPLPTPTVPLPTPTVAIPTQRSTIIPTPTAVIPTPRTTVIQPKQPIQPMQTPPPQPQIAPRPIVTAPVPGQGGMLRQFGGVGATITRGPQVTASPTVTIVAETGYSILMKLLDIWEGTPEQAQQLSTLQYITGAPIIDVKRRDVIMEIVGMLQYQSLDEVIDFLTDAPNPEFVLWDQESLDEGRIKVAREITIQQAEEVGIRGVGRCRYCPSTELVFAMKQLRSGDEPATIFVRCVMCNKQWRQ
jgi:hypothetical protein